MIILLFVTTACVLSGCVLMVRGLVNAPEGYQDEYGFHFAGRRALVRADVLASTARGGRDSVRHVVGSIAQA
jgi:hypothetical protein